MGHQKASAFGTVFDMTFESGLLQKIDDRSKEMEMKRGEFRRRYNLLYNHPNKHGVTEAFSLDMDKY
ncbi:MAG: hypothetical protein WC231_05010 [Dehalococcoidales bacterium]